MSNAHAIPAEAWVDEIDDRLPGSGELARLTHEEHVQGAGIPMLLRHLAPG